MGLIPEVTSSFLGFVLSIALPWSFLPIFNNFIRFEEQKIYHLIVFAIGSLTVVTGSVFLFYKKPMLQVIIRSSLLGTVFFLGTSIFIFDFPYWTVFGWYMCILSFFHWSEYFCIAISNPKTLTLDAFMLNHSFAYGLAAAASWSEFLLEHYFISWLKRYYIVSVLGVILCIGGEFFRKTAIITASTNFNHIVQTVKDRDHMLITNGVYSICRHPSYVGWFYWSIGTQLVLVNPICVVVYAIASWSFFKTRLLVEEEALIDFFGDDYIDYKKKVTSGLPFNDGIAVK